MITQAVFQDSKLDPTTQGIESTQTADEGEPQELPLSGYTGLVSRRVTNDPDGS